MDKKNFDGPNTELMQFLLDFDKLKIFSTSRYNNWCDKIFSINCSSSLMTMWCQKFVRLKNL